MPWYPPTEAAKGAMRTLLKATIGMESPIRNAQLNQYFYPDRDLFPKTDLRPQSLTKFKDQDFRSLEHYLPNSIDLPEHLVGKDPEELGLPYKLDQGAVDAGKEDRPHMMFGGLNKNVKLNLAQRLGLGHATMSLGRDEKGVYLSIFDSWDFEGADNIDRWVIKSLGKPYNLYNRVYIPLEDGKLPASVSTRPQDIELPSETAKP